MIEQQIEILKTLRDQLNEDSCLRKEPFIKLGTGTAPTLNYNLPQSTCFSTYGDVPVELDLRVFKNETKQEPTNNYFQFVAQAEPAVLQQQFSETGATAK